MRNESLVSTTAACPAREATRATPGKSGSQVLVKTNTQENRNASSTVRNAAIMVRLLECFVQVSVPCRLCHRHNMDLPASIGQKRLELAVKPLQVLHAYTGTPSPAKLHL